MALLLNALMGSSGVSIPGFSRTLLIIQKSKAHFLYPCNRDLISFNRVLLATIRDKGLCPCPRCLVTKSKLDALGTRQDISVRLKKFREFMADRVTAARQAIYVQAKSIRSTIVENILKSFSGVPTTVSSQNLTAYASQTYPLLSECLRESSGI
jgi:hypothetical protein